MLAGVVVLGACLELPPGSLDPDPDESWAAGVPLELNDNGAYSWFSDERVVVQDGKLVVGSVRAVGLFKYSEYNANAGNVEVMVWDLETGAVDTTILFNKLEQDDHNSPSFLPREDGGLLAIYGRHRVDREMFMQYSVPGDPRQWSKPVLFVSPGAPTGNHNTTYSNTFRLPSGRILNFYRGYEQDNNYMYSDDDGITWTWGGRLFHGLGGYSPYFKYRMTSAGAIHFVATEEHPRRYDTSIYHGILDGDRILLSDGTELARLSTSTEPSADVTDLTVVFQADPDNVAWMTDLELDDEERPVVAFSVQKDGRDKPQYEGGLDLRYHYARRDGAAWRWYEMAYAGERLYSGEEDYSGLATIDHRDARVVYISTNADPAAGDPLLSASDGLRHHELFRGETADDGASWTWEPLTRDSTANNMRPLVPRWDDERTVLVWMRGTYLQNRGEWTTAVMGMILDR